MIQCYYPLDLTGEMSQNCTLDVVMELLLIAGKTRRFGDRKYCFLPFTLDSFSFEHRKVFFTVDQTLRREIRVELMRRGINIDYGRK